MRDLLQIHFSQLHAAARNIGELLNYDCAPLRLLLLGRMLRVSAAALQEDLEETAVLLSVLPPMNNLRHLGYVRPYRELVQEIQQQQPRPAFHRFVYQYFLHGLPSNQYIWREHAIQWIREFAYQEHLQGRALPLEVLQDRLPARMSRRTFGTKSSSASFLAPVGSAPTQAPQQSSQQPLQEQDDQQQHLAVQSNQQQLQVLSNDQLSQSSDQFSLANYMLQPPQQPDTMMTMIGEDDQLEEQEDQQQQPREKTIDDDEQLEEEEKQHYDPDVEEDEELPLWYRNKKP